MGQTNHASERKHTGNQAKVMEIHTSGGKKSSNAHKSNGKTKRKGKQNAKKKKTKKVDS